MLDLDDALELIDDALVSLVAVGGLEMAHMSRDDGWRFLSLGRHLERLHSFPARSATSRRSRRRPGPAARMAARVSDSLLTYRVRYMQQPEWEPVVDLMLVDERNPRSAQFRLTKLADTSACCRGRPHRGARRTWSGCVRLPRRRRRPQGELFGGGERSLEKLLAGCQHVSLRLGSALSLRYFSHVDDVPRATVGV